MLPEQTSRAGARGGSALSPGPCRVNTPDTEEILTSDAPATGNMGGRVKCIENGKNPNVLILIVCPHTPDDREHASTDGAPSAREWRVQFY